MFGGSVYIQIAIGGSAAAVDIFTSSHSSGHDELINCPD